MAKEKPFTGRYIQVSVQYTGRITMYAVPMNNLWK